MIPTAKEINPYPGDLDGEWAVKNWFGKTIEDGISMYMKSPGSYNEDFMYLGEVAFNYYFDAINVFRSFKTYFTRSC